jgi:hypothetical protein
MRNPKILFMLINDFLVIVDTSEYLYFRSLMNKNTKLNRILNNISLWEYTILLTIFYPSASFEAMDL